MSEPAVTAQAGDLPVGPEGEGLILLLGSQRSGTTWLQDILSQHPSVASCPETDLFAGYLALMKKRWLVETKRRLDRGARTGIQDLVTEAQFYSSLRVLADAVLAAVLATKPGSNVVLEKTPHNVLHVPLILDLFPRARFIHLIRDPRSVVASLRAAAAGWGGHWAERGAVAGAERWCAHVEAGIGIPQHTTAYYELRYEDLKLSGSSELMKLFHWLDVDVDVEQCERFIEATSIDRRQQRIGERSVAPVADAANFYRKGSVDSWREELPVFDRAAVEVVTGHLMRQLNYELEVTQSLYGRTVAAPAARLRIAMRRLVGSIRWRLNGWLNRIEQTL